MSSKSILSSLKQKNMLIALLMGFSSGIPLLLTLRTLQAWMTEAGVDLKTVGIFALAGVPYTLKFLWAPLMDRFVPPFLGRRRGWLIITQVLTLLSIFLLSLRDPAQDVYFMAFVVVLVTFFSASQDIVVDAYRRESLSTEELGMGSTLYVYGYRGAMWVSGGFALGLAEFMSWSQVYQIMALFMGVGIITSLWATEPKVHSIPKSTYESVIEPIAEFFGRNKASAFLILLFILFYKMGDTVAGNMLTPFYLKLGYTKLEIAGIAKTLSLPFTLFGGFLGGLLVLKFGLMRSLWTCGVLQAFSTLAFVVLNITDKSLWGLGTVILFEDVTGAMGTAAFVAFMASFTNRKYTATQYALLTSLSGVPRTFIAAPAGFLAEATGWTTFFVVCSLLAIPGLLMIPLMKNLRDGDAEAMER